MPTTAVGLVDGAHLLHLLGDIAAEVFIRYDMEFTARKVIVSRNDLMIPPPTCLKNPLPSVLPSTPARPPSKNNAAD